MWNRFSFIWPQRPPSGLMPTPPTPSPSTVPTSDHLTNWRLWGGWNVFCPVWCDCLQRNGLTLPYNATHTRTHTHALAELEVCETDLLSAGGLGPSHHFLQTENRGPSQLKPGWDNNELSSHYHHLVSGIIETFTSYFFSACSK